MERCWTLEGRGWIDGKSVAWEKGFARGGLEGRHGVQGSRHVSGGCRALGMVGIYCHVFARVKVGLVGCEGGLAVNGQGEG